MWQGRVRQGGQGRAGPGGGRQGRAGQGGAGPGRAGQGGVRWARAGQGRAGQGRAGQGRAGQGRAETRGSQIPSSLKVSGVSHTPWHCTLFPPGVAVSDSPGVPTGAAPREAGAAAGGAQPGAAQRDPHHTRNPQLQPQVPARRHQGNQQVRSEGSPGWCVLFGPRLEEALCHEDASSICAGRGILGHYLTPTPVRCQGNRSVGKPKRVSSGQHRDWTNQGAQ